MHKLEKKETENIWRQQKESCILPNFPFSQDNFIFDIYLSLQNVLKRFCCTNFWKTFVQGNINRKLWTKLYTTYYVLKWYKGQNFKMENFHNMCQKNNTVCEFSLFILNHWQLSSLILKNLTFWLNPDLVIWVNRVCQ